MHMCVCVCVRTLQPMGLASACRAEHGPDAQLSGSHRRLQKHKSQVAVDHIQKIDLNQGARASSLDSCMLDLTSCLVQVESVQLTRRCFSPEVTTPRFTGARGSRSHETVGWLAVKGRQ